MTSYEPKWRLAEKFIHQNGWGLVPIIRTILCLFPIYVTNQQFTQQFHRFYGNLFRKRRFLMSKTTTYLQVKHCGVCFVFHHRCLKCSIRHCAHIYHDQRKSNRLISRSCLEQTVKLENNEKQCTL